MKIAVFHDYFGAIGGAEKLVLTLARGLGADVITTDVDYNSIKKMDFDDVKIISIGKTIKHPILKQLSTCFLFASCNFKNNYDFFIFSGNWAHFAAKIHKPNLYYCHTPVKAFYEKSEWIRHEPIVVRLLFKSWAFLHKYFYEYYLGKVQTIIANSKNTQFKIKKYLARNDVDIIYPPIDCSKYYFRESENFWLSVNRFYPEKRIELQIESFKSMPEEKLIIVASHTKGDYAIKYAMQLMRNLSKNIEIHDTVTEKDLIELYSRCKGFITTARDEDFGMAVVEAMAAGKPVLCVREGGYLESIIDGITGLMVEPQINQIIQGIREISKDPLKYKIACQEQAKKFDTSIFVARMKEKIKNHSI
jgi:glycosyltransferase involved in cell wall biosynthesis